MPPVVAQLVTAGSMTGALTSKALDLHDCSRADMQAIWTGTPTGAFSFEVSNRNDAVFQDGSYNPLVSWTPLTLPAAFAAGNPGGVAGNFDFGFVDMGQRWLRLVYTPSASTGSLDVYGSAKA